MAKDGVELGVGSDGDGRATSAAGTAGAARVSTGRSATRVGARSPQHRLRQIIERLADGIVVVDRNGVIRFANPAAERLFGRPVPDLVGTPFGFPIVAGETTEIDIVQRGAGIAVAELRVVDTEWDGEAMELVSLRDVTHRKQAEERTRQLEQEQRARAEAEAASHAKSEFLAIMSHELRTPLNAILGYSELLDLGLAGALTDPQREQLSRIRMSGRHLLGLVNEVLDLAKVEAGRLTVRTVVASAQDALASAVALVQPQAEARGLVLTASNAAGDQLSYVGDDERVRQILVNLLSNSVKFTNPGGSITITAAVTETPDREARLSRGARWVAFRVTDTGRGIPESKLEAIFDPFVQAESGHTRQRDGSGLGLTISRKLARLMGGDLTVRSQLGRGSTFTLWLPSQETIESAADTATRAVSDGNAVRGLADLGEAILRDLESLIDAIVARLRTDEAIPMTRGLKFSQVADHIGTFLADVAESLVVLEESEGQPSPIMSDATEIQRLISDRHGLQRARLGYTEQAMRREWAIIRSEMDRTIRRIFRATAQLQLNDALAVVQRFLDQGEYVSVRSLERNR